MKPSQAVAIPVDAIPAVIRGATREEALNKLLVGTRNGSILSAGPLRMDQNGAYVRVVVRPASRPSRWRGQTFPIAAGASVGVAALTWAVLALGWTLLAVGVGILAAVMLAGRRRTRTVQVHTSTTVTFR